MHAAFISHFGDSSVIQIKTIEPQAPIGGEVQIKITSAGLNRADILYREGRHYMRPATFPARIGYEGAGIVTAVGPETQAAIGERVALFPCGFDVTTQGALAQTVTVPYAQTISTPAHISDHDAGAYWMMYLTASGALLPYVKKDATVAISAASSSVGMAAIATCRALGAFPIALTTQIETKWDALLAAGAHEVLDIRASDLAKQLKAIDVAFCAVSGPVINSYTKALKPGGRIIQYGLLDASPWTPHVGLMIGKHIALEYFNIVQLLENPMQLAETIAFIQTHIGKALPIHMHQTFPLNDLVRAMEVMEANRHVGKIVILP